MRRVCAGTPCANSQDAVTGREKDAARVCGYATRRAHYMTGEAEVAASACKQRQAPPSIAVLVQRHFTVPASGWHDSTNIEGLADSARHVLQRIFNPRVLR